MAQQMMLYDLSYQRRAFKPKIDPYGLPRMTLESSLKHAARIVYSKSEGRWLITLKAGSLPFNMNEPVELTVIVPAGSDQYEQYLAAVKEFENCITGYPFSDPMDTSLRTIEGHSLLCVMCGETPKWRYPSSDGIDDYFCDLHVRMDPRFAKFGLIRAEEAPITI